MMENLQHISFVPQRIPARKAEPQTFRFPEPFRNPQDNSVQEEQPKNKVNEENVRSQSAVNKAYINNVDTPTTYVLSAGYKTYKKLEFPIKVQKQSDPEKLSSSEKSENELPKTSSNFAQRSYLANSSTQYASARIDVQV